MFNNGNSPFGHTGFNHFQANQTRFMQQHQAFQRQCEQFRQTVARNNQMWQAQLQRNRQQQNWLDRQRQMGHWSSLNRSRRPGSTVLSGQQPSLSNWLKRRR